MGRTCGDFQCGLDLTLALLMIHLRVECDRRFTDGFLFCCSPQCLGFTESVRTAWHLLCPWILLGYTSACVSGRRVCSKWKCNASSPSSPLFPELLEGACGVSRHSGEHPSALLTLQPTLSLASLLLLQAHWGRCLVMSWELS